jgi:hypothetical protein
VDACPGRLNQIPFRSVQEGLFYGQCSEICGVGHAFMPIMVNVLNPEEFRRVVISDFIEPDTTYSPINIPPKPKPSNYLKGTYTHFKLSNNVSRPLNLPIERFSNGTKVLDSPVEGLKYNSKKKEELDVVTQFIMDNLQPQPRRLDCPEHSNSSRRAKKAAEKIRATHPTGNGPYNSTTLKNVYRNVKLQSLREGQSHSTMFQPSSSALDHREYKRSSSNSTPIKETRQIEKKLTGGGMPEDRKGQLSFLEELDQVESKQETKIDSSKAVVEQASNTTTQLSNDPSTLDLTSDSDSDSGSDDSL